MSSCKTVLTSLREAIDSKLPADQRCPKTIAQMTEAVNGIKVGGAKYYKCRAVHAGSKTWDGYEVTFDDRGISAISDTLTTGLTYGAIVPIRQNIYSADGVQQVRGAMMSGNLPTPFYYVSGETPGGNIWVSTVKLIDSDGDNKSIQIGSVGGEYSNNVDGVDKVLPGFPDSASNHDWAFTVWHDGTFAGQSSYDAQFLWVGKENRLMFFYDQISFDSGSTWNSISPLFSRPTGWQNLVFSYNAANRKYSIYVNGNLYAECIEETAVDRRFDHFAFIRTNNVRFSHVYVFPAQITADQAKLLAKQRWIFEGLELTGLDDVYNSMYGYDMSPNGKLKEYGTYMNKPRYYAVDEYDMSLCTIQWNGTHWEIYVDEYDPDTWEPIKKILATGEGGNDPSEADWTNVGYGLPTVKATYANGI